MKKEKLIKAFVEEITKQFQNNEHKNQIIGCSTACLTKAIERTAYTILPDYMEISNAKDAGGNISAVEKFLLDNEVAGAEESKLFRAQLVNALNE